MCMGRNRTLHLVVPIHLPHTPHLRLALRSLKAPVWHEGGRYCRCHLRRVKIQSCLLRPALDGIGGADFSVLRLWFRLCLGLVSHTTPLKLKEWTMRGL
jgi:hypothetical protein